MELKLLFLGIKSHIVQGVKYGKEKRRAVVVVGRGGGGLPDK